MTIPTITDDLIAEIEKEFRHAYERNSVPDVSPEEGLDLIAHIRQLEKDAARYRWIKDCEPEDIDVVIENPGDALDAIIDSYMQAKP